MQGVLPPRAATAGPLDDPLGGPSGGWCPAGRLLASINDQRWRQVGESDGWEDSKFWRRWFQSAEF